MVFECFKKYTKNKIITESRLNQSGKIIVCYDFSILYFWKKKKILNIIISIIILNNLVRDFLFFIFWVLFETWYMYTSCLLSLEYIIIIIFKNKLNLSTKYLQIWNNNHSLIL